MHRNSQSKRTSTDNSKLELKIKGRKKGETKSLPPRRRDQMLCAIHCCQNRQDNNDISQPFLYYNEPDLYNNYISKEPGKDYRFNINFPGHCAFGHVL